MHLLTLCSHFSFGPICTLLYVAGNNPPKKAVVPKIWETFYAKVLFSFEFLCFICKYQTKKEERNPFERIYLGA